MIYKIDSLPQLISIKSSLAPYFEYGKSLCSVKLHTICYYRNDDGAARVEEMSAVCPAIIRMHDDKLSMSVFDNDSDSLDVTIDISDAALSESNDVLYADAYSTEKPYETVYYIISAITVITLDEIENNDSHYREIGFASKADDSGSFKITADSEHERKIIICALDQIYKNRNDMPGLEWPDEIINTDDYEII